MATILNSSMYPPIMETYANPFIYSEGPCKVPFTMSSYQTVSDIKNIQISVTKVTNNKTALNKKKYPNGLIIKPFSYAQYDESTNSGFVLIKKQDLEDGFALNAYYKIQIRFGSSNVPNELGINELDWLNGYINTFSEWSSVTLAYGISNPVLRLNGYSNGCVFSGGIPDVIGTVQFENGDEEKLDTYQVSILQGKTILESSGYKKANNAVNGTDEIEYVIKRQLEQDNVYTLAVDIITNSLYNKTFKYNFSIIEGTDALGGVVINATPKNNDGYIEINIRALKQQESAPEQEEENLQEQEEETTEQKKAVTTNVEFHSVMFEDGQEATEEQDDEFKYDNFVTVRRTSNLTNFLEWEDFYTWKWDGKPITLRDYTAESGVFYKYCIQQRSINGERGPLTHVTENDIYWDPDDIFIIDKSCKEERILKIKYNPNVSSFKENVQDSVTNTLGSKYPFVTRNGHMYYKTMSLSGLISIEDECGNTFFNSDELYSQRNAGQNADTGKPQYQPFYENRKLIYGQYNHALERFYREKVMDFLYNDNIKLYKSLTEGNIICKITDVSLIPKQTLGRLVYEFSCTVTEVDEFNLDNCVLYNIHDPGKIDRTGNTNKKKKLYGQLVIGQLEDGIYTKTNSFKSTVESERSLNANKKFVLERIIEARVDFLSYPTPIENTNFSGFYLQLVDAEQGATPLVINWDGVYEFYEPNSTITDICINHTDKIDDTAMITYYIEGHDEDVIKIKTVVNRAHHGQLFGQFDEKKNLLEDIEYKYNYTLQDDNYNDKFISTFVYNSFHIEAEPTTKITITYDETTSITYEINELQILDIYFKEDKQPQSVKITHPDNVPKGILFNYEIQLKTEAYS